MKAEKKRLQDNKKRTAYWQRWGPYIAERQWGTVREDYSLDGNPWNYFTYENALSRCYRWGEDGIAGLSDTHQRLCFALSFWNGEDPFIKERLFGLGNLEGNHGEDVKEYYYYLDNTPTHSYMKFLYKYPQSRFPYEQLRSVNGSRTQADPEYELVDTGIFDQNRYFDIFVEYAKAAPEDIYIRLTIHNRGDEKKTLHVLPTLWMRNRWHYDVKHKKPHLQIMETDETSQGVLAEHFELGERFLYGEKPDELLFTDNETNLEKINSEPNQFPYTKDGINDYLVLGKKDKINPKKEGTKVSFHYIVTLSPGEKRVIYLRLSDQKKLRKPLAQSEKVFKVRKKEADAFYEELFPSTLSKDHQMIARQAIVGMLWNKVYYHYVIPAWLDGDVGFVPSLLPHKGRAVRNEDWRHLYSNDILSTPDSWEFPAFFSWDTAFHTIPIAMVDPEFAKRQIYLLTQEWYMHPNGQIPAYEWNFSDVNPPVHAWATWRVYKIEKKLTGKGDRNFLEQTFQKLLINFTWWVNRKDFAGKNIFQGGFLGLDNISIINRSEDLPKGAFLYQSDATSWMAMYCLNMLTIALELAREEPSYQDMANKFYNHFLLISEAINFIDEHSFSLWHEDDGFYYDILKMEDGRQIPLKIRSLVGLMPLFAVSTIDPIVLEKSTAFKKKMDWFSAHRKDLCAKIAPVKVSGINGRKLLAILNAEKLGKILKVMLNEEEFLSPYGIRSISKYHEKNPFKLEIDGKFYSVSYEPGDSSTRLYGGNSNWRGPIWIPINVLIIESLQKFYHYYGDDFKVECPTGSGHLMTLWEIAAELSKRLVKIFEKDQKGERPVFGNREKFQTDPEFQDYILYHEYFHGNTGEGLGSSHQLGWTGFIAKLLKQLGEYEHP